MNAVQVKGSLARKDPQVLDLVAYGSVSNFLDKVFPKDKQTDSLSLSDTSSLTDDDTYNETAALIEKASRTIEGLSIRCEILEAELDQERVNFEEQYSQLETLQGMVRDLKAKNDATEANLTTLTSRCQDSQNRVIELENDQKLVLLRASKAEGVSNKLQQQVEAAFGQGSPIWSVMNGVKLKQAAE